MRAGWPAGDSLAALFVGVVTQFRFTLGGTVAFPVGEKLVISGLLDGEWGHVQNVSEIRLDCDNDVVLLKIEQVGGIACHTGRRSCFFQKFENGRWVAVAPVLKNPDEIYK